MKKVLILSILLIFAFSVSAFAEVMTNEAEGIVLTYGIGFGGSANDLEDANKTVKLYDIKGQPVIGRNFREGVFRWWGAGYHLWGPVGTATIEGEVRDVNTNALLDAVLISIGSQSMLTAGGLYRMENVAADTYTVTASKIGYITAHSPNVAVPDFQTITVDFNLEATFITEGPDDGDINETRIERFNGHVKLYWNYNKAGLTKADIWRFNAGPNGGFSDVAGSYIKEIEDTSATEWEDTSVDVGDGENYYYRVVPYDAPDPNIMDGIFNKRTMGKVDIRLRDQYNAVCNPFNVSYIDVLTLMGDQLEPGDQIHSWNQPGQTYGLITRLPGGWPSTHNVKFADGFFIYLVPGSSPRDVNLTLVGLVGNFASNITMPLGKEYNFKGYPYPVVRDANVIGFIPDAGDQFHIWGWDAQGFGLTTYVNSAWNQISLIDFSVGESKFYYVPTNNTTDNWVPVF